MRKTKFTAIVMMIVASMLSSLVPTWAQTINSIDLIDFNLEVSLTSSDEYGPVVYGTDYGTSSDFGLGQLATKKFGRHKLDGEWNGFATLNFDNIAEGSDFAAYGIEYKDGGVADISDVEDTAIVAFDINKGTSTEETVSIQNLYYALMTRGEDGVNFAGIPVTSLEESTGVSLSEFTDANNFLGSTGTGESIDLTKFCGLGFVRMNISGDAEVPASSGRIYTKKLAILSLNSIDDLAAEAYRGEVNLTFTAPTVEGLVYTIEIAGNDGSERSVTLTSDDFVLDGINYVWTDTEVEEEVTYTYTITLEDDTYGISSVSNSASVRVPEDIGGEEIPSDGESSTIVEIPVKNYAWYDGVEWLDYALGAPKTTQVYNPRAQKPELASQNILKIDLAYDNTYKNDQEATEYYGHMFDYYVVGYIAGNLSGGPSFTSKECTNIGAVEDTGSVVYRMYIDETMELTNAYFTIGQRWYGGNKDRINFMGVPMYDYITDEDKGKVIVVSIPLTDFKLANPNAINRIWSYSWDSKAAQEEAEVDLEYFNFIGLMRDCNIANEQPESSGNIYISDMMVSSVDKVKNLEIRDVTPSKITLGWEHSETLVDKYNIYRVIDGEKELVGTTRLNRFADTNNDLGFEVWETYDYYVEAVDKMGVKSHQVTVSATVEPIAKPKAFKVENYYSETDLLANDISWQPVSYGSIAKYVLYRNGTKYQEFGIEETSYRDTGIVYGKDYTYHMVAIDKDGNSSIDTEKITVTAACVSNIENVEYAISDNDVTFSWDENPYAEQYGLRVNGEVFVTDSTSYTVNDLPYHVEIDAAVWAINAAGAKSLEYKVRKFNLEKPGTEIAQTLLNESVASGFKLENSGKVGAKFTSDKYIVNNVSLACDFNQRLLEDQFVMLKHSSWNIKDLRDNNSTLSFWIYVEDEVDLNELSVALESTALLYWGNRPLRAEVELATLVPEKNKWIYVEIPLLDFGDNGTAEYQGQYYVKPMDYAKLKGISFIYNNELSLNGAKFYLDDIRIIRGVEWSVEGIADNNEVAIENEISANAKSISVAFSEAMDASTINSENVWIEDGEGNVINTIVTYEDEACVISFLEPLAQSTDYTLNIENVKSEKGVMNIYTKTFTSNTDEVDGVMAEIPAIAPVVTGTPSGSTLTVTLAMPQTPVYNVADYEITITYDRTVLAPNGAQATTLYDVLTGATVTYGDSIVTISGNASNKVLSGDLAAVKFSVIKSARTNLTVGGTVDAVNVKSTDVIATAVSASNAFTVTKGSTGGGSTGGGGGGGGTASRENATVKDDTKVDLTNGENQNEGTTSEGDVSTVLTPSSFTDINSIAWAKDAIVALIEAGVISGYPDNTVKPEKTITREEFASMLVRTFGFKTESVESPFADVANDAWYANAIIIAQEKGIVSGIDAENFGVGSTITREDMCTMIYRAMQASRMSAGDKYDAYDFADAEQISSYASDAVTNLYKSGIISGVSDTEFAPKAEVNRAMAARVLYGVMGLM